MSPSLDGFIVNETIAFTFNYFDDFDLADYFDKRCQ